MTFEETDAFFMTRALELAQRGLWTTSPNPRVGCVLVRDGQKVGEGWHEKAGEPHAEVHALRQAGVSARGATAYITLEPCSHTGRTPPCADALIAAGVVRAVVAMEDPNPLVAGRGLARLRAAGVAVEVGLEGEAARALNSGFVRRMVQGRPWVRAKLALSLDGKTALGNGVSQWITGMAARTEGHRWRARSCAVATGGGTVQKDNPALTVREVATARQPLRLVLDPRLETPTDARLLGAGGKTTLFVGSGVSAARRAAMRQRGAEIVELPEKGGRLDLTAWVLEWGKMGLNEVLVEAGPRLTGALLEAGLVDEMLLFIAPMLLGEGSLGAVVWHQALTALEQGVQLEVKEWTALERDWLVRAEVRSG